MKNRGDKSGGGTRERGESIAETCESLSSERYQAFVESIEEGVYEVDIHGNFIYFNDSLARIFGYPREEIQFQNFRKFIDEGYQEKIFNAFNRIYRSGRGARELVWRFRDKEGASRIIEISANLITNREGQKVGFRGIARDITEKFRAQEALRESESRYRTLLDFVPYPIVVFTLEGRVAYLNPAFTEIFGWTLDDLRGKTIPYVPPGLEEETRQTIQRLFKERVIRRHETRRLTKEGRTLDVVMRGAVYSEQGATPAGELVILRDITQEKRMSRNNEALLRISLALPEYPELDDLLEYISSEIRQLLGVEGALVILLDEEKQELSFKTVAYGDSATQRRAKAIRWPAGKGVAGKVIRTGKSIIVPDISRDEDFYSVVDLKAGFKTRSLLDVPLRSKDRIIGVLCAMNKENGRFDRTDVELLEMIAGSVALSVENARFSNELKAAYKEVSSLNRAKDRVINHLSHELKTPLSVLSAALNILTKKLSSLPADTWRPTIERARRNLQRILEMQYEVEDIMRGRTFEAEQVMSVLVEECADLLASMVAEETGEEGLAGRIAKRIDDVFCPAEGPAEEISLHRFVRQTLEEIRPLFAHRQVKLVTRLEKTPPVRMPADPLKKVVVGLIKNAVENTPDGGRIEIDVVPKGKGGEVVVHDYGVGIIADNQRRIFEGFFATQETMDYSSKHPYDFNAGGKGADLLRMKIFSERYKFEIQMTSRRCGHIPRDGDKCPGKIKECVFCSSAENCYQSGGTTFRVFFPAPAETDAGPDNASTK